MDNQIKQERGSEELSACKYRCGEANKIIKSQTEDYMQIDFFNTFGLEKIKSDDWKWSFKDYPKEKNGLKVFSCFACGGGSTMGYKLAGCDVVGCCEIDPKMNEVYVKNHNPKYNYLMDIREFNKLDNLPMELYNLDILDGSPPCTTFSMAGKREETWGKKKKFREGQQEQTLDDLSFVFIDTVAKLKPKVVIMENVEGLIKGNAWAYVQKIYAQFKNIGYSVKHWLIKGEDMGVPQTRHRVFFIATNNSFNLETLDMSFNYAPVTYGEIKEGIGDELNKETRIYNLLKQSKTNDTQLSHIVKRTEGKESLFNYIILQEDKVFPTLSAGSAVTPMRGKEKTYCTIEDLIHTQTFPVDYDFVKRTRNFVQYICGMSVPPLMIKRITARLIESGIFKQLEEQNATRKTARPEPNIIYGGTMKNEIKEITAIITILQDCGRKRISPTEGVIDWIKNKGDSPRSKKL